MISQTLSLIHPSTMDILSEGMMSTGIIALIAGVTGLVSILSPGSTPSRMRDKIL
jgi:hypothetical protein